MRAIKTTFALISLIFCISATANPLNSGFFYIYNDTDRTIKISVGDYGPSNWTIGPHKYANILTAKDNPDIRIVSVS